MFLEEHRKNIHVCELTAEVVRQLIPLLITTLGQSSKRLLVRNYFVLAVMGE